MTTVYSAQKVIKAASVIKKGGVIIAPSEGIYGISALFDNKGALERIVRIKRRDPKKGLIVISDTITRALPLMDLSKIPSDAMAKMHRMWPSHTTFVVPAAAGLLKLLTGDFGTVAIRVTAFSLLQDLVRAAESPVVSTSANIAGMAPSSDLNDLAPSVKDGVDYILDLPCQGLKGASTIYDVLTGELIRRG